MLPMLCTIRRSPSLIFRAIRSSVTTTGKIPSRPISKRQRWLRRRIQSQHPRHSGARQLHRDRARRAQHYRRWSSGDLQLGVGVQRIAGRGGSPNRPDESEPDCQVSTSESFRNQISPTSRSTVMSAVLSRAISLRWDSAGYSNSLCHVRHGEFVLWWIERSRDISRYFTATVTDN